MFLYIYIVFSIVFYKVLVTLRFLAKGDYLSEVADLHGISLPSTSKALHSVCHALNNKFSWTTFNFPHHRMKLIEIRVVFTKLHIFLM